MQWTPNARPQEQRRPYRDVLDALQERVRPFIERQPEFARPAYGSVLQSGADMLPGVGDVVGVEDLQAAARDGDPVGIGLGLLAAIPGIPAIGRGSRGARRGLMTGAREAAPSGGLMTDAESALARYRAVNPDDTGARVLNPGDEGYPTNAQWDEASQAYVAPVEPDYPIRAYHGSPHSFDQFSLDKIGTGEGAQAYGHGLYFAESEDVARGYRDQLSDRGPLLNGRPVESDALRGAATRFRTVDDYISAMTAKAEILRQEVVEGDDLDAMIKRADLSDAERRLDEARAYAGQEFGFGPQGSMYEVGINAHPDTFLDYDAPMSRQPEGVRRVLGYQENLSPPSDPEVSAIIRAAMRQAEGDASQVGMIVDNDYGLYQRSLDHARRQGVEAESAGDYIDSVAGDYLRQLSLRDASADDLRSLYMGREQELFDAGVPGVRYRDGFSRGNDTADSPTSNYVLFNDELIKILRKYGISGLGLTGGAALGGGLLGSPQDQQAQPTTF